MGDVMSKFLDPLREVYPLPKHAETNLEKFFSVYLKMLKTFADDTLSAAADHIMEVRNVRTFPLPAECNAACKHVIDAARYGEHKPSREGNRHEHLPFEQRYPEWQEWRIKKANELVCSDLGREALGEGWIVSLHDFCREQQRVPDRHELVSVRNKGLEVSKDFEAAVKAAVGNPKPNPLILNLINLRTSMFDRLRKAVNGTL